MSKIVNGSSLQPLSGGSPKQIVLPLQGFGSNGADLISLALLCCEAYFSVGRLLSRELTTTETTALTCIIRAAALS